MLLRCTILMAALLVGACSTTSFNTQVSGLAASGDYGTTFFIIPGSDEIDPNGLEFQSYKTQAVRALEMAGYREAPGPEADLGIVLSYAIGDPQTYSYSVPLMGKTGTVVTGSNTYGTVNTYGNNATLNANTTYQTQDTYGVVGTTTRSATVYSRFAILAAYDVRTRNTDGDFSEVWRTTITSTGSSGDLRRVFPVLMAAGYSTFGKQTPQAMTKTLREEHRDIKAIKGFD